MPRFSLIVYVVLAAGVAVAAGPTQADEIQVQTWVRQLESGRFSIRENATHRLIDAGPTVIDAVKQEIQRGSLESSSRGLTILRELALQDHVAAIRAEEAIQELAKTGATAASQRALGVLESLNGIRTDRGIKILRRLGATFSHASSVYNEQRIKAQVYITFGESWRGTIDDLDYLAWLTDFERIQCTLRGAQVTDQWLARMAGFHHVVSLQINRARVTDDGLRHLRDMRQLESLSLRYNSISDACYVHLEAAARATHLQNISVYGTQISAASLKKLEADSENLTTTYRRGGFLGVSGKGIPKVGCLISTVQPNQAADRAGIRPGDIVLKYGEHAVTVFSSAEANVLREESSQLTLSELIGADAPGRRVELRLRRGDQEITKEVVLGEWP